MVVSANRWIQGSASISVAALSCAAFKVFMVSPD
jgi:hypothetical protein